MTLENALLWVVSTAGLGTIAYIVMHWLDLNWTWFSILRSDYKRVLSWVFGGAIGMIAGTAATLLLILLQATGPPGDFRAWANLLWMFGFSAGSGAQAIHVRELSPRYQMQERLDKLFPNRE